MQNIICPTNGNFLLSLRLFPSNLLNFTHTCSDFCSENTTGKNAEDYTFYTFTSYCFLLWTNPRGFLAFESVIFLLIHPYVPQHQVQFIHTYQKTEMLLDVLRHHTPYPPVIVFASSKEKVDHITSMLQEEQFHAAALHSGYPQDHRNNVVRSFRADEIDILVATDLASRGLDVPAVTRVINYDTPDTIEDYVHRVGRTGRFGRQGYVTTFLTLDCRIASELRDLLEASRSEIPRQLMYDTKMFGKNNILHTDMGDRVVE